VPRTRVAALLGRADELAARLSGPQPLRVRASRQAASAEASRIDTADPVAWETAARLWEECGDRYQTAYAHWRRAEALLTIGRERRSAQLGARKAYAIASAIGARPLVEAIAALARRGRLDLGTEPALNETSAALQRLELTPREVEVFALVGEGMTNRQIAGVLFIAEKTASVHVSRILAKLSVPNRAAAAAAAQRLGVQRLPVAA
jgi:DNA-binding CsgD family transcriptional regulator